MFVAGWIWTPASAGVTNELGIREPERSRLLFLNDHTARKRRSARNRDCPGAERNVISLRLEGEALVRVAF